MMEPPIQNVILPTTTLMIASPSLQSTHPRLKIRITPHLQVPSPPFAPGVSGRKIEDCVNVVVGIGGKVDFGLGVEVDGLEGLCEGGIKGWEGIWAIDGEVKKRVKALFKANMSNLALTHISQPNDDLTSLTTSLTSPRPIIQLSPLISNPSHSHLLKTMTTTGRPQAYLTKLDIKLEWVPVKATPGGNKGEEEKGDENNEESPESQDSQESQESGGNGWDEDEFCDLDQGMLDDSTDDALSLDEIEDLGHYNKNDISGKEGGLPVWATKQLKDGIHKIMRTHMIRRFPLLFDAGLIAHAPSLEPHRSLTSSLTRFLTLSSAHSRSTPLKASQKLLRSLAQDQESFVRLNVEAASNIRGIRSKSSYKKRKIAHDQEHISAIDPDSPKGRTQGYMEAVNRRISEEDDGPQADERSLRRLIGEAMGRLGRAKWEARRRGTGRMAAFRVPLADVDLEDRDITHRPDEEDIDGPSCMAPSQANEPDAAQPVGQQCADDIGITPDTNIDAWSIWADTHSDPLFAESPDRHDNANTLLLEIDDFADVGADDDGSICFAFDKEEEEGGDSLDDLKGDMAMLETNEAIIMDLEGPLLSEYELGMLDEEWLAEEEFSGEDQHPDADDLSM